MSQIISTYIVGAITSIGTLIFVLIVLNKKFKTKYITIVLIESLLSMIISLTFNGTIKTLLIALAIALLYMYFFNLAHKKAIFLTFLYLIIIMIAELIQLLIIKLINMNIEFCYNTYAGGIIANILSCIIAISLTYILKKILKKLLDTKIDNSIQIIIFSILTFISTTMFFYTIIKEFKFGENIVLYLVAIIVLLIVLFSLIKQTIENKRLIYKYDKLLEFMTSYEKEIEKIRVLRHETKNEFLSIKSKIIDKQKEKDIIKYIDEILNDKHEFKNEIYAKFGYLPANGIKGLCYFKTQEAETKGLKTSINISSRIENSFIYKLNTKQNRDLGKILGVLLDNAIEGALETKEKVFGIEVYLTMKKECKFIITNSCNKKINPDTKDKISTKGKNRGHGLLLANYIINKNNIFTLETQIVKGLYIQKLVIKKPIYKK